MSRQGGGGGEKTFSFDDPAILLGIFAAVYILCWAAWYFAHRQISTVYMYIRYAQLWVFNALGSVIDLPGVSNIHNWVQRMCEPDGLISVCHRDFTTVQWRDISDSSIAINVASLVILVYFCFRMFARANKTHPKLNYTKSHNIKSFVKESKELYPHLRMFSELDLIAEPLDHPVFGMSLTSRQFAYKHRLISGWKDMGDGSWTPTLDREKATQVFRLQLGKHWTKSTELSPGETLLAAIAIPRVAATDSTLDDAAFKSAMKDSEDLVKWCWDQFKAPPKTTKKGKGKEEQGDPYAWLRPEIDLTKPREVILKHIGHPNVQTIIEHHAFNRTVIFGLFMQARRLGVLQPAEMRWLRFFDRELWYILETIGRQAGYAEAAAVLSHYLYESKSAAALAEPQLDKAVNGLDLAMTTFKFLAADKTRYEKEGEQIDKT